MNYCFLCNDFLTQYKNTDDIKTSIKNYIHNNYNTLKDIYFEPKKIEKDKIEEIINSIPNKQKSYYTIVPNTTVEWVENNIETIDKVIELELDKNNMMYDFFYMFAKTKIPNMPVRTGDI